jgi:hypothetical protein
MIVRMLPVRVLPVRVLPMRVLPMRVVAVMIVVMVHMLVPMAVAMTMSVFIFLVAEGDSRSGILNPEFWNSISNNTPQAGKLL